MHSRMLFLSSDLYGGRDGLVESVGARVIMDHWSLVAGSEVERFLLVILVCAHGGLFSGPRKACEIRRLLE